MPATTLHRRNRCKFPLSLVGQVAAILCLVLLLVANIPRISSAVSLPPQNSAYVSPLLYYSPFDNLTFDFSSSPLPSLAREGSVYASEGEVFMYWGGGINSVTGQAYSDFYLIDTINDIFTACPALPTSLAYSSALWCELLESVVIYGGVTSAPTVPDVYQSSVLLLSTPNVNSSHCNFNSTSTIASSMPGRKYAAAALISTVLYVLGGYNQASALSAAQLWFSIDLVAGSTTALSTSTIVTSTSGSGFPVGFISPVLISDSSELLLYVYGGLTAPQGVSGSAPDASGLMYRFDAEREIWLSPITPLIASNSAQITAYPLIALSCATAGDPLGETTLFLGGTDGLKNSLDTIIVIDFSTDATVGLPTITTLYTLLPMGLQGCAVGRNQLGELTVLGGLSVGIDSWYGTYPTFIMESALPLLGSATVVDTYSSFLPAVDITGEWAVSGRPLAREGAAYGCDGSMIYMAGGAVLTFTSILALNDIWLLNTTGDSFIATSATLPVPLYFGVSEWLQSQHALYVWGGRTNTVGNGVTNTYSSALYKVDFTTLSSPVVSSPTLLYSGASATQVQGVHFASSVLLGSAMFVWGGLAGANGSVTLPSQQFFSISLTNFTVSLLPTSGMHDFYPGTVWLAPALFSKGVNVYLYSGLSSDYVTWSNPSRVYVYNTQLGQWTGDIPVLISPYSSLSGLWPNVALSARAYSSDGLHVLLVGGTQGDKGVSGPGSHSHIVHIDLTNVTAAVTISVLPSTLLQPVQSAVVGLTASNQALFVFSGATYPTTGIRSPTSYSSRMQEVLQTGYESTGGSSTISTIINNTFSTVTTVASSSVTGGQIAGVAIGSVLGACVLIVGVGLWVTGAWRSLLSSSRQRGSVWVSGRQLSSSSAMPISQADTDLRRTGTKRRAATAVAAEDEDEEDEEEEEEQRRAAV